ncbi:hypothetical protein SCUCBS95973_007554 [Sporothrix curviconia]|uniref:MINDY deubiquitinase domain-containing protein n=1 Tax=Sporothrix curviconia TaxID=1260050 RepID=A0ABP0CGP3_9PEZI
MVARKPLPQSYGGVNPSSPGSSAADNVPDILRPGRHPVPPSSSTPSSPFSNFDAEEQSAWRQPALQDSTNQAYRPPPQQQQPPAAATTIPTILLQSATGSSTASGFSETNPFKRKILASTPELPASSLAGAPPSPSAPPPPPPAVSQPLPPTTSFSQMSMEDQNRNPWQPAPADVSSSAPLAPIPVVADTSAAGAGENAWASQNASAQPSGRTTPGANGSSVRHSNLMIFPSDDDGDTAGWDEVASASPPVMTAPGASVAPAGPPRPPFTPLAEKDATASNEALLEDRNAWDDLDGIGGNKPVVTEPAGDGWNLVDTEPVPGQLSRQSTWENFTDDEDEPGSSSGSRSGAAEPQNKTKSKAKGKSVDPTAPAVDSSQPLISIDSPPPTSKPAKSTEPAPAYVAPTASQQGAVLEAEPVPQFPPRSMLDVGDEPPRPAVSGKPETYQVKNISWYDFHAAKNPRVSPILVQNANGPCPLVALVNALSLTTPADVSTSLTEMLKAREQVSLSFLLSAVFDELMSSRRSGTDSDLPDVDELYKFLKGLHTGMNVNPRFIPTPENVTAFRRTSLTHLHPTERDDMIPGTFEDTREMRLYATFHIPLIHGWLPTKDDGAYEALSRQATSYEDVQNLLFREEELEDKLSRPDGDGLTEEEQQLFQDILEIKTFLQFSATQLTPFGLEVIAKAMLPGNFAILFRNDHFSTLYRHPQTLQLLSLVTDAGYASHDEVIWETLVDVNGEHAEFYSGDFRLVGGNNGQQSSSQRPGASGSGSGSGSDQGGWTTVRGRRQNASSQSPADYAHPLSNEELSRHEQEDRDLALALQLQEEEEERHRSEEARRNSQLSERFIEQNARPAAQPAQGTRRPSNAAGGGRYSSSQAPVSQRRSSAGFSGSSSLLVDNNAGHRRTSSSSASGSALGATNSNGQRVGRYSNGVTASRTSSAQQIIRPLIPPSSTSRMTNTRPAVNRAADDGDGEEAPPSYEQAAKQAPYHPPPGAPGSESAAAGSSAAASSSNLGTSASRITPSPRPPPRQFVTPGNYPQSYRPQQTASNRADRECTIM